MIRRWSSLILLNTISSDFFKFEKRRRLIFFRSAVSLKRFNFKITKFKRKSFIRRKHYTNWLIYLRILAKWSRTYKFNSQLAKFQFTNKILLNNYFCFNADYVRKKFLFNDYYDSACFFLFVGLSKRVYFYFHPNLKLYFRESSVTYLFCDERDKKFLPRTIVPAHAEYGNNFFQNFEEEGEFNSLAELPFLIILNKVLEIRKLLSLLTYLLITK